jgi:hypothetical protein
MQCHNQNIDIDTTHQWHRILNLENLCSQEEEVEAIRACAHESLLYFLWLCAQM